MNRELYKTLLLLDENDRNVVISNLSRNAINEMVVTAGLLGAGGAYYLYKRKELKDELKKCESLSGNEASECKKKIGDELKKLNKNAALGAGGLVGGGIGFMGGGLYRDYRNRKKRENTG